ncbi:MAG: hypothetical protein ACP5S8_07710 [Hydrogenobaculum sp.]
MFFISEASPLFFILSIVWLIIDLILKAFTNQNNINIFLLGLYGFFLNVIMGAMYQLIPNSLMKKPKFPKLSFAVFGISILNGFIMLMWYFGLLGNIYFSFSNVLLILVFITHISTALKLPNSITTKFLTASLIFLMLNSIEFLFFAFNKVNIFFLIHTFTIGFVLNAVIGVELALVPLLYMEPLNMGLANKLFWIHQLSASILMASFYVFDLRLIYFAGILEFIVLGFFVNLIYKTVENRKFPKNIPYTLRYFFLGLGFLFMGVSFGLLVASGRLEPFLHADVMIYGFGLTTVLGGIFHFMPRILWNKLYANKLGQNVPPIDAMINQSIVKQALPMLGFGLFILIVFEANQYLKPVGDILYAFIVAYSLYAFIRK